MREQPRGPARADIIIPGEGTLAATAATPATLNHAVLNGMDQKPEPGWFAYDQARADQVNTTDALRLLDALRHPGERIWLQVFADAPHDTYIREEAALKKGGKPPLRWRLTGVPKARGGGVRGPITGIAERAGWVTPEQLHGRPYLLENMARCGVFWCVNTLPANAPQRKAEHISRVAALFLDLDGKPLPASFPIQPTAVVESSPGRFHVYWAADGVPLEEFTTLQRGLAAVYGGDSSVSDLPRVMRLPGYWHNKEEPFLVALRELHPEAHYTRDDLLQAWPQLREALATTEREQERQEQTRQARLERADELRQQADPGGGSHTYGEPALRGLEADVLAAQEGQRNSTLNAVAYRAGRLVAAGALDEEEARTRLTLAAEQTGLESSEIATTLQNGLEAGKKEPADLAHVGRLTKPPKKRTASQEYRQRTQAAPIIPAADGLPAAALPALEQIPIPEGEHGTYSDRQVRALLGITWPVLAVDTDKAHAHRLRQLAGDDLGHVPELGGYVAWNGRQWLSGGKDGPGQVEARRRVQGLGVAMRPELDHLLALVGLLTQAAVEAGATPGQGTQDAKLLRHKAAAVERAYYAHARAAKATESDAKQRAILSSARTLFVKDVKDFEPRPWLVGFQNGTWDRGTFRPNQREDHLLALAATEYHPDADQRAWREVLHRITGGDEDLARTLQDVAGYALSGASSLRLLPWLYGEAGTGKSTFSELLATVLGDMAATIDPKLFSVDAPRERLGAAIWGRRVALCAEAGNARLDAEALKTLSGGDRLSVRMLYSEGFTARASHVLLMVANDPPRVEAYDDALRERVLALPFSHPLREGGPLLGGRRIEELRQDPGSDLVQGFTAWAVEGLNRVHQANDVHRAQVCLTATRAFWEAVDPLNDFWLLHDREELARGVGVTVFRQRYETWCSESGSRPLGLQKFNRACRAVGLEYHNTGRGKEWRLVTPAKFPQ